MTTLGIEIVGAGSIADTHDMFIGTLGYESRSSHLARNGLIKADRKIAIAFPQEDYASYAANQSFLVKAGFEIIDKDAGILPGLLASAIEQRKASDGAFSLLVDISSMSRPMLADIVYQLSTIKGADEVLVTFAYLPSDFVKLAAEYAPVAVTEPVTPEYAGWTSMPERPITAVVGLGYEHDLALGTIEYLEPTAAWIFMPTGEDRRYDDAVKQANRDLRGMLSDDRAMTYQVDNPTRVHAVLESLVYGLLQTSRPILIPFGPKIFSLCCLLIARTYAPAVTVWRVSGESYARPGDRQASGKVVSLRARFACRVEAHDCEIG